MEAWAQALAQTPDTDAAGVTVVLETFASDTGCGLRKVSKWLSVHRFRCPTADRCRDARRSPPRLRLKSLTRCDDGMYRGSLSPTHAGSKCSTQNSTSSPIAAGRDPTIDELTRHGQRSLHTHAASPGADARLPLSTTRRAGGMRSHVLRIKSVPWPAAWPVRCSVRKTRQRVSGESWP